MAAWFASGRNKNGALNLILANHRVDLAYPVASAMSELALLPTVPPSEGQASTHHVRLRHLLVPGYWRRGGSM
jgi:hypothetical protein